MVKHVKKLTLASFSILSSAILFVVGTMIYLCFRDTGLLVFDWVETIGLSEAVEKLRLSSAHCMPKSSWVLFSLPDGLWVLSYVLLMSAIWSFDFRSHWLIISLVPMIAIISEVLQLSGLLRGTFDIMDLLTYSAAFLIGIAACHIFRMISISNNPQS